MLNHSLGNFTFLIVDNDSGDVENLSTILRKKDALNIRTAENVQEAKVCLRLEAYKEKKGTALLKAPDFMFINVFLPDTNGFELCKLVKNTFHDTNIIMLSDYDVQDLDEWVLENDADDFMYKPVSESEVFARIEMLLDRKQKSYVDLSQDLKDDKNQVYQLPHIGNKIDKYMIMDVLGWSRYAIVYKVMDATTNQVFALKLLTRYSMKYLPMVKQFKDEMALGLKINHPNVVKMLDTGTINGCPYFIMEFVDGVILNDYLLLKGLPDVYTVLTMALSLARGIQAIHENGIIHNDIKMNNVFFCRKKGNAKISDFGTSALVAEDLSIAKESFNQGTPLYMAPEVLTGEAISIQSDIYSFGVTMYYFITENPPLVKSLGEEETSLPHVVKPIRRLRPDIPEELDALIVNECLAEGKDLRPNSMTAVIRSLEKIINSYKNAEIAEVMEKKYTVVVVDDELLVRNTVSQQLASEPYEIITCENGLEVLEIFEKQAVDLLITDYVMPVMDGLELIKKVTKKWPMTMKIILSGETKFNVLLDAVNQGHIYSVFCKPWNEDSLKQAVRLALQQYELQEQNRQLSETVCQQNRKLEQVNDDLENKVAQRTNELLKVNKMLSRAFGGTVDALMGVMELENEFDLSGHGKRVAEMSAKLAAVLGLAESEIEHIRMAAFLHDIGKMAMSINSQAAFRDEEKYMLEKKHATIGANILRKIPDFDYIADLVENHHENIDGTGYPAGKIGSEIPLGARIISVTDAFDRLIFSVDGTSWHPRKAIPMLQEMAGVRLDSELVGTFIDQVILTNKLYRYSELPIHKLIINMILAKDLATKNGDVLLVAGTKLDDILIKKIKDNPDLDQVHDRVAILNKSMPEELHDKTTLFEFSMQLDDSLKTMHQKLDDQV